MNQNFENITRKELTNLFRKIDMLATIYEKLERRYRLRSRLLDLILFFMAIIFSLLTLVDPKLLEFISLHPDQAWLLLRIDSFIIFTLIFLSFLVDWKGKTGIYRQAKATLYIIQIDCQEMLKLESIEQTDIYQSKNVEYNSIINRLPVIPAQEFNKLKTFYKRHQEISRLLESFPGSSVWLMRIFIFCRANLHLLLRKPFLNQTKEDNV